MIGFWGAVRRALGREPSGKRVGPKVKGKNCTVHGRGGDFDYKLFFDKAADGMLLADLKTKKLIFGNARIHQMLGYSDKELRGLGIPDLHPKQDLPKIFDVIKNQIAGRMGTAKDLPMLKKNGQTFFADISSYPISYRGHDYVMGIFRDVTQRKLDEDKIKCLDRLYRVNSKVNQTIVKAKNREELFSTVCDALVEIGGFKLVWIGEANYEERVVTPVAFSGKGSGYIRDLRISLNPRSSMSRGPTGRAVLSGQVVASSNILQDPKMAPWRKGAIKHGYASSISLPLYLDERVFGALSVYSGEPSAFTSKEELELLKEVAGDISFALLNMDRESKRREAEAIVLERDERFSKFASQVPGMLYQFERRPDGSYRVPFCTPGIKELYGTTPEEAKANASVIFDAILPEDLKMVVSSIERSAEKMTPWNCEYRVKTKDGKIQWLWGQSIPEKLSDGGIVWHGFNTDVTEKHRMEDELKAQERNYHYLYDHTPVMMHSIDPQDRLISVSDYWLKKTGYRREEVVGRKSVDFLTPASRKYAVEVVLPKFFKAGVYKDEPYQMVMKDGSIIDILVSAELERDAAGEIVRSITVINDITELKRTEAALKDSLAKDEALLSSIADGVVAVDSEHRIILINDSALKMFGIDRPDAIGKNWHAVKRIQEESGTFIPPEKCAAHRVFREGVKISDDDYYYTKNDGSRFPISRTVSPVVISGKIVGAIEVFRDITERKALDSAKSEFLSIATHQLRTPLTSAKWVIELMRQDESLSLVQKQHLDDLEAVNAKMVELVGNLLSAARIETGKVKINKMRSNVKDLIDEAIKLGCIAADKKGQTCKVEIDEGVKGTRIDPLLFKEALSNILANAINFAPEDTIVTVRAKNEARFYLISVNNKGSIVPAAEREKMFGRFFRGADAQKMTMGSGLGLFIAKASVEANGGKIWFESNKSKGTTFYFTVPKTR